MKFNKIKFENKDAQRIYENYLKQIKSTTKKLSKEDQQDVLLELNSHIYESLIQNNYQENEVNTLLNVLDKIGIPNEVLKNLVAEKKLEQATKTFNPIHIMQALILNISNGIIFIIFAFLYFPLFCLIIITILKLFYPSNIGFFYKEGEIFQYGGFVTNDNIMQYEVLGYWFIPVTLLICVVFYLLITLLLKLKRSLKKVAL